MNYKVFIFVLFSVFSYTVKAQYQDLNEDEDQLFWQPNVQINYSHFQSESKANCIKSNEQYGLKMSPNIQLIGIVDVPKSHHTKKIKNWKGYDISYLAPVFCKGCSCILSQDSVELLVYQLLFDVAELSARGARKELKQTRHESDAINSNTMYFTTIKNVWDERMKVTWASIYQEVLLQKKDGAYTEWRVLIDELLEKNKDFATQPNEIKRLILGRPIEQGYVQANYIMGDAKSNNEN